jgi:hypothetical protein
MVAFASFGIIASSGLAAPVSSVTKLNWNENAPSGNYQLIIYGGTPSGVAAAISANKHLDRILLISDRPTFGGAISNGLGAVDIGTRFAVTGIARSFFANVQEYYGDHSMWRTEPHVAENIFRSMLGKTHVQLASSRKLTSVTESNGHIDCIVLDEVDRACAREFIDASYTGDLIEQAHAANVLGPKDLYGYDEPEANRRHFARMGSYRRFSANAVQVAAASSAYIQTSTTMPYLRGLLATSSPSWTYRLCLTRGNKRSFVPGPNYQQYLAAWRLLIRAQYPNGTCLHWCRIKPNGTIQTKLWQIVKLPHGKYDLNAGTAQLSNFPIGRKYFNNPETRLAHEKELQSYLESFLYFAQNDSSVPNFERAAISGFGLCADEFTNNNNWPYAPYIREGRRLIGKSTLTSMDIMNQRVSPISIAIGSYQLDTKSSQIVYWKGAVYRDVGSFLKAPTYEIPFTTMLPKHGPDNLLSSVNISASPTAFGSVRIEAQFMELGQAAGTAAALAIGSGRQISHISTRALRRNLNRDGLVTSITQLCRSLAPDKRSNSAFDPVTCRARKYLQATPYDNLYGKLTP